MKQQQKVIALLSLLAAAYFGAHNDMPALIGALGLSAALIWLSQPEIVIHEIPASPPQKIKVQRPRINSETKADIFLSGVQAALAAETEAERKLYYRASFGQWTGHFLCARIDRVGMIPFYIVNGQQIDRIEIDNQQPATQQPAYAQPEYIPEIP